MPGALLRHLGRSATSLRTDHTNVGFAADARRGKSTFSQRCFSEAKAKGETAKQEEYFFANDYFRKDKWSEPWAERRAVGIVPAGEKLCT